MDTKITEREQIFQEDLQEMLLNTQSRRFVWWVLQQCGIYDNKSDPESTGRRGVGLTIIHAMSQQDQNAYPNLMIEMGRFESELQEIEKSRKADDED